MNTVLEFLTNTGIFLGGLMVRSLLVIAGLALLALPFLLLGYGARLFERLRMAARGLRPVDGLIFSNGVHYSNGHGWLRGVAGGNVRLGLDSLATRLFKGTSEVVLPKPGQRLDAGDPAVTLRCEDRQAVISAPISGTVVRVNIALEKDPSKLERTPYTDGWIYELAPSDASFKSLPVAEKAREWFRAEEHRFSLFLESNLGYSAADGGDFVLPIPSLMPKETWDAAVREFLNDSPNEVKGVNQS